MLLSSFYFHSMLCFASIRWPSCRPFSSIINRRFLGCCCKILSSSLLHGFPSRKHKLSAVTLLLIRYLISDHLLLRLLLPSAILLGFLLPFALHLGTPLFLVGVASHRSRRSTTDPVRVVDENARLGNTNALTTTSDFDAHGSTHDSVVMSIVDCEGENFSPLAFTSLPVLEL